MCQLAQVYPFSDQVSGMARSVRCVGFPSLSTLPQATKVKQLRKTAHAEVKEAVLTGELSIHKAWQWIQEARKNNGLRI
jgi:hypothetical protein